MVTGFLTASSQQLYDSLLNKLNNSYQQEKLHMQLDKAFYNPGETLWFKTYLFTGGTPSQVSKTVYAELINERGAILQRKTMPVLQSGAASSFDLPDSNKQAKLFIRAYTSWMLNFDSSSLYIKPVNIIHANALQKISATPSFTLTFFPEGGDPVEDIQSRLAFKTNDQDGKPFAVKGTVNDSKGRPVADFNSTHNGMGVFNFTAGVGEKYTAVWKDPKGLQHTSMLPEAKKTGVALKVLLQSGNITYTVTRPELATDDFKEFVVLGQINHQTAYAARISLKGKTTVTAPINTDSLPDGIMIITVFNKAQLPVAERIVFINNNTYSFPTDIHLAEKNLAPRGKNVLQIDVGGAIKSNLSVAVTDADLDVKEGPQENIFSRLLLTSDLKGYVYDPAYYFASDEDSVKQQLDLVMMTNGWRRYKWEELLADKWPKIRYSPDNYLSVQGNVFGLTPGQLGDRSLTGILQTSEKGSKSFINIPLNKDGSFKVSGLYFFDTVKIYYQINNDKNKTLTSSASFSFNSGLVPSPVIVPKSLSGLYFSPKPPQDIVLKSIKQNDLYLAQLKQQKVKVLETVTVVGKQKSPEEKLDKEYASGLFSSGNSRIFATADDPFAQSSMSILDYLRGKVAGLQISTDGATGGSITRRGSNTDVFLNEMRTDISMLQSTPMTDVAMIKVFDPPFFGASGGGAGGAVAVYTKRGSSANSNVKGLDAYTLFGYSSIKEFYSPNYEANPATDAADYRTTLYWNPFVLMDAKAKRFTIPFYNNDSGKKIKVIVEGLNDAGLLTREEKIFQ
jgi:hypothetical protein